MKEKEVKGILLPHVLNTVWVEESEFIVFPLRLWDSMAIREWTKSFFTVNKVCNTLFHYL